MGCIYKFIKYYHKLIIAMITLIPIILLIVLWFFSLIGEYYNIMEIIFAIFVVIIGTIFSIYRVSISTYEDAGM